MRPARCLAWAALCTVFAACDAQQTALPTSPTPAPGLEGTIDVSSRLNSSGAYEYTIQIHLSEEAGLTSVVTEYWAIADVSGDGGPGGPFGPIVQTTGREAWTGDDNRIGPHGTLTSRPFVIRDEVLGRYAGQILAEVRYSVGASTERWLSLRAPTPPHPQFSSTAAVRLDGTVVDSASQELVGDVLVKDANVPDAGRQAPPKPPGSPRDDESRQVRPGTNEHRLLDAETKHLHPDHEWNDFAWSRVAGIYRTYAQ
jgi:hypothetical protein